jgi:hypothetical protein
MRTSRLAVINSKSMMRPSSGSLASSGRYWTRPGGLSTTVPRGPSEGHVSCQAPATLEVMPRSTTRQPSCRSPRPLWAQLVARSIRPLCPSELSENGFVCAICKSDWPNARWRAAGGAQGPVQVSPYRPLEAPVRTSPDDPTRDVQDLARRPVCRGPRRGDDPAMEYESKSRVLAKGSIGPAYRRSPSTAA